MGLRSSRWEALGTDVAVFVEREDQLNDARLILESELRRLDLAASRFRTDSELWAINRGAGRWVEVGPLCLEAVEAGLRAARLTAGLVDPTIGRSLRLAGYDRDHRALAARRPARVRFVAAAGWQAVEVDRRRSAVRVAAGVELDLGATAKALGADRAAAAIARQLGTGVMVDLGGDIAVAGGAPAAGWPVRVTEDHAAGFDAPGQTVAIRTGGLATSSITVRRWAGPRGDLHHILDPRTGKPAGETWRAVSIAAASCLDANTASTAAVLHGPGAPRWLERRRLPARLTARDGETVHVAGWPREEVPA